MPHVTVTINGRQFRVACDDGQEHHLGKLARDFDQRIGELRKTFGEIGDMRLTVMAALIIADELSDLYQRMGRLEEELAGMKQARSTAAERDTAAEADLAAALNSAAERVEKAARLLGQAAEPQRVALG
jgi:cell division protein ZapA